MLPERNVGGLDRTLRAIAGLAGAVLALALLGGGRPLVGGAVGIAAAGLLFNALTGYCGVNHLLGRDTCSYEPGKSG